MRSNDKARQIDRALGLGGLGLAAVASFTITRRIEVSGDAEVVPALTGLAMLLAVLVLTARHLRVHRGGRGKGWLTAGWALLGVNVMWSIFQAMDTAAFDEGIWHGLGEFATGPPILLTLIPLVLCSVAVLIDSADADVGAQSRPRRGVASE